MKTYKYLLNIVKDYRKIFLFTTITAAGFQLLIIFPGLISREIFANILSNDTSSYIVLLLIGLTLCPVLNLLFSQVVLYLTETLKHKIGQEIRINLLKSRFTDRRNSLNDINGEICVFRDDVDDICECLASFVLAFSMTIFTAVAIAIMFSVNVTFTAITIIPIFAIMFIIKILENKISKFQENIKETTTNVNSFVGQIFQSVQTIKIFNCLDECIFKLHKLNNLRKSAIIKNKLFNEILIQISGSLVHLALATILLIGVTYFKSGKFFIGEFALFEYYFWFIGATFPTVVVQFYKNYKQLSVSVNRIEKFSQVDSIDEENATVIDSIDNFDSLKIDKLIYNSSDSNIKIDLNNAVIKKNTLTVITGCVGSGKTTLLKLLLGLLKSNDINLVLNNNIRISTPLINIKNFVGYTPQTPHFINGTIEENILMGINRNSVDMNEILYRSALDQDLSQFASGLKTPIGADGGMLSGGQRKRLAIARMLAVNSKILFIDDMSSAVDTHTEHLLWERLFSKKDYTYVLVSHRKTALDLADNIINLN